MKGRWDSNQNPYADPNNEFWSTSTANDCGYAQAAYGKLDYPEVIGGYTVTLNAGGVTVSQSGNKVSTGGTYDWPDAALTYDENGCPNGIDLGEPVWTCPGSEEDCDEIRQFLDANPPEINFRPCVSGCVCFTGYEVEITYPEVTCPEAGGGVSYQPPFTFGGSYYFVSEVPIGGGSCLLRIAGGAMCAVESEGVYTECDWFKEWAWTVDCSDGEPTLVAVGEDDPPWSCGCQGQQDACDPSQCTIPKPTVSVRPIPPNPLP